ncbi:MAG TPA: CotH kinase family protein [Candidatus Limnocylindria bacterium]|jgi:spore coat protein CotH|nr:CotH kinase family protein [Candidatus Limnocylindria bacterium]
MLPPPLPKETPPPLPVRPKKKRSVLGQLFRIFLWTAAIGLFLLVVVVGIGIALWNNGRATSWALDTAAKKDKKAAPIERPWPDPNPPKTIAKARTDASSLKSGADFFSPTNVWLASFHFTDGQWNGLGPDHVAPAKGLFGGDHREFPLSNTNASRNGLAGAVGLDFKWSAAEVELGGVAIPDAKIRFKGNGTYLHSRTSYKRPLKLELPKGKKNRLAGERVFNFGNLASDNSGLADTLAYEFFRDAGVPAPRTAFARTLLTIDGQFTNRPLGLYVMVEDIDERFLEDRFGDKPPTLFKPVTYHLFKDLGPDWSAYAKIYDPKKKIEEAAQKRVIECSQFVTTATDEEFARRCGEFFDLDETARFIAVLSLISSYDGFLNNGQNFYMYLNNETGQFGFIPWDLDHSWGGFIYTGTAQQREIASVMHPLARRVRLVDRLLAAPAFQTVYRKRVEEIFRKQFDPQRLSKRVDDLGAVIRPVVAEESDYRIQRFEQAMSATPNEGFREGNPEDPQRPVHKLKVFFEHRAKSVADQLAGKSEGHIFHLDSSGVEAAENQPAASEEAGATNKN